MSAKSYVTLGAVSPLVIHYMKTTRLWYLAVIKYIVDCSDQEVISEGMHLVALERRARFEFDSTNSCCVTIIVLRLNFLSVKQVNNHGPVGFMVCLTC